jgi:putative transposase
MIERGDELPLTRQPAALGISRGRLYCQPRSVSAADLAVMRRIDELHLEYPFAGSRMLRDLLRGEGVAIARDRVTTMMRRMAIEAVYRRPNTSKDATHGNVMSGFAPSGWLGRLRQHLLEHDDLL